MWHYQRVHATNTPLVSSHNALQPVHWLVAALRSPREHWVGPTWAWQEKTQRLWFFNDGKWEDVLILLTSSRGIHANLVKHIHISCECKGWNKNTLNKYIVSDCYKHVKSPRKCHDHIAGSRCYLQSDWMPTSLQILPTGEWVKTYNAMFGRWAPQLAALFMLRHLSFDP